MISEGAEKIGDKFKRKLRQTLNSMDQHSSGGMPAVQRARTSKGKRNWIYDIMLWTKKTHTVFISTFDPSFSYLDWLEY